MCTDFVGSIVSLDCGDTLGTYQGQVRCINNGTQELTIVEAFRNGLKCPVSEVTLNASDIKELKIIKTPAEAEVIVEKEATPSKLSPQNGENDVFCPSPVKVVDTPVHNSNNGNLSNGYLNAGNNNQVIYRERNHDSAKGHIRNSYPHSNGGSHRYTPTGAHETRTYSPTACYNRYTPTNGGAYQKHSPPGENGFNHGNRNNRGTPTKDDGGMRPRRNSASDAKMRKSTTPRKIEFNRKKSQSRDDCFSAPTDSFLQEFDFEKNLSLFDKKAVFEEIENANPDCVKIVDNKKPQKYRCDENVLQSKPVVLQQIKVPNSQSVQQFVTDAGLVVPCISYDLRNQLFSMADNMGFGVERQIEMVGRSASEMVLQLLGGSTRLNPKNGHQLPTVVVMCGPHKQGAFGVNCARQLSNHNVKVQLFIPSYVKMEGYLQNELKFYDMCDGKRASLKDLPSGSVDIIINAMDNHEIILREQGWHAALTEWANQNRAPVLSIDPPATGASIQSKWSLSVCLPLLVKSNSSQVYLCDMGFPKKVFSEVGIKYVSPFSHKFIIALHPR